MTRVSMAAHREFARRVKLGEIAAARASLKRDEAPVGVFGVTPQQRRKTNFASPFKSIERFKSQVQKYSSSGFRKFMIYVRVSRAHKRGASRSSRVSGAGCDGRVGIN